MLGVVIFEDGEDAVEERRAARRISETLPRARVAVVGGGVGGADEVEDGGAGFGGVEVVGEGGGVGIVRLRAVRRAMSVSSPCGAAGPCWSTLAEGAQAVDGVGGFGEAVEGEVELVAVGDGDEQEADGGGAVALEQQVAEGVEVALGLGHLAAFDEQEADVHPVAGEGLAGGAFGLGDLVFVVREHEVFAAGVEVEGVAEELGGHGGALDVPAGAAGAERGVPGVLRRAWRPSRGRSRGRSPCRTRRGRRGRRLRCLRGLSWRACRSRDRGRCGSTRSRLRPGRRCPCGELLDERDHLGDVLGGVGDVLGALDAEGVQVFEEGLLEARRCTRRWARRRRRRCG